MVIVGGGLAGSVILGNRENSLLCEGLNANRATIRNLLVSARNQTPKHPVKRYRRARKFFNQELRKIEPLDCGNFRRDSLDEILEPKVKPKEKADKGGGATPGQTRPNQPP